MKTYYYRPLYKGSSFNPDVSGRYYRTGLDLTPQPKWIPLALLPLRLIVAGFLHLERALVPDIDPQRFGHMFRSKTEGRLKP